MSDPSADAAGSAPRATLGSVVKVALALVLLTLAVWSLGRPGSRPEDPRELLAGWFAAADLPFGLEPLEAYTLAGGEQVVRFAAPAEPIEGDAPRAGAGAPEPPPEEVLVFGYPRSSAAREIAELFKVGGGEPSSGGGPHGGGPGRHAEGDGSIERGELAWREFSVRYVREREREEDGEFRDTVRVDLASEGRPCVLFARWPAGVPGSVARTGELLAALAPRARP
jgi:hypothetical protein